MSSCGHCVHWASDMATRTPIGRIHPYSIARCMWQPDVVTVPISWPEWVAIPGTLHMTSMRFNDDASECAFFCAKGEVPR